MAHACRGTHWSLLSRISSNDFPGHFASGSPRNVEQIDALRRTGDGALPYTSQRGGIQAS